MGCVLRTLVQKNTPIIAYAMLEIYCSDTGANGFALFLTKWNVLACSIEQNESTSLRFEDLDNIPKNWTAYWYKHTMWKSDMAHKKTQKTTRTGLHNWNAIWNWVEDAGSSTVHQSATLCNKKARTTSLEELVHVHKRRNFRRKLREQKNSQSHTIRLPADCSHVLQLPIALENNSAFARYSLQILNTTHRKQPSKNHVPDALNNLFKIHFERMQYSDVNPSNKHKTRFSKRSQKPEISGTTNQQKLFLLTYYYLFVVWWWWWW